MNSCRVQETSAMYRISSHDFRRTRRKSQRDATRAWDRRDRHGDDLRLREEDAALRRSFLMVLPHGMFVTCVFLLRVVEVRNAEVCRIA